MRVDGETPVRASECLAIAIDTSTGELVLPPQLVSGIDAVRVLAWAALRCSRGEFFTDLDNPTDLPLSPSTSVPTERAWFGGRAPSRAELEAQVRLTLASVPGVGEVASLRVEALPRRESRVEAVIRTQFDDEAPAEVAIA